MASRLVIVDSEAYVFSRSWVVDGWRPLQEKAPYQRDYLLPSPSGNYKGVQCRELRYDTAFAVYSRLLALLTYRGSQLFNFKFRHFWSPHSGRNFRPTVASVLNVPRSGQEPPARGTTDKRGSRWPKSRETSSSSSQTKKHWIHYLNRPCSAHGLLAHAPDRRIRNHTIHSSSQFNTIFRGGEVLPD